MSSDVTGRPWELAIRHSSGRGGHERVVLELSSGDGAREVVEVPFKPLLNDEIREMLHWYFDDFRAELPASEALAERVERTLLDAGSALGYRIEDDKRTLARFGARATAAGVHLLHVRVSSNDPDFLREPWELLVLPESKYFVAATGASFVRGPRVEAEGELEREPIESRGLGPSSPLRALRVVDRQPDKRGGGARGLRMQADLLRYGGALAVELLVESSGPALLARLSRDAGVPHVVHLCGRLEARGDSKRIEFGDGSEGIDSKALFDALARSAVDAVLLDIRVARGEDRAVRAGLALDALRSGVSNVVLLAENADAITAERCFHELYVSFAAGLGVHRGVVEARKRLQKAFLDEANACQGRPYGLQPWSLLTHYGRKDVVFLSQPAAPTELEDSPPFASARGKMFGFLGDYLRGEAFHGGEADCMSALAALERGVVPVFVGPSGSGKTRALHACALSRAVEGDTQAAFYWDFAAEDYTANDVIQMMAGVLGVERPEEAERHAVLDKVAEARGVLVLDNFPGRPESEPSDGSVATAELLREAVARGARCLVSCDAATRLPAGGKLDALWQPLPLRALTAVDGPEVVREKLGARTAEEVCAIAKVAHGNPFLLVKISALASPGGVREAVQACARALGGEGGGPPSDPVRAFYSFRWQTLDPRWQRLLVACLDLRDLYLEVLMIASDGPSGLSPRAGELWEALELPPGERFADAMAAWERAGFLIRRPYGRNIDPSAVAFLQQRRGEALAEAARARIAGPLAALVCEGCATLVRRLRQQQHPWMTQHLISNRALWAKQIESLWFRGDHAPAAESMVALETLLVQARLIRDYAAWAKGMLERTDFERIRGASDPAAVVGWLSLAGAALAEPPHAALPAIADSLPYWSSWIERASDDGDSDVLFERVFSFVRQVLDLRGEHAGLKRVSEIAVARFAGRGRTPQLVAALKLLCACEHELGDATASRAVEDRLIHEIDYGGFPAGARDRVVLDLAGMRRKQGQYDDCERLLSILDQAGSDQPSGAAAEMVRAQLDLDFGRDEQGAQRLCELWKRTMAGRPGANVDQLLQALAVAESKLGADRFAAVYRDFAGDTPTPRDLQRSSEESRPGQVGR
jgi:hypothetical protein